MEYRTVSLFIIGTELTRGIIADGHGQLMARELSQIGYHINRIVIVPDDGTLGEVLRQCLQESDIVILTGGLGPTSDDMTRSLIASIAGVPLVQDEQSYKDLYTRIGERIHGANQRQVYFPEGFHPIVNPKGTAPGFTGLIPVVKQGKPCSVLCFAMPGPPVEMHEMFYHRVLPELAVLTGHDGDGRDEYSCFLIPESKLEDACVQVAAEGVLWGTRVQEHRISLYLSGGKSEERTRMIEGMERMLGTGLISTGDIEAVDILSRYLQEHHLTISCAESCTGGYISKLLTDRPGSSQWFWGGAVTYSNEAKIAQLKVTQATLDLHGAVSAACVEEMARGMLISSGTDLSIAISGIAGPEGGSIEKPIGLVWFGFASKGQPTSSIAVRFSSYGRASVRRRAAVAALLLAFFYANGSDLLDMVQSWQYI
ncbi:MAG: competence/damage-inducible protein A [Spirochaetae bacterium HGW-Spirochaetae-8]|nr:MAG: competence/damage-inducible protein A [Spirochaetae bacterium HGW-Spirochaetae-8]